MQELDTSSRGNRRTFRRYARFAILLVLAGWAAATFAVTWTLTRRITPRHPEPALEFASATRSDLILTTPDGETLGAWLFPGMPDAPAVVVMHGNNGSRGKSRATIEKLINRDCTVLAVTLRAHGDSTGVVNDIGWSARRDVVAAVDYLEAQFPGRPILVCGRSMSSAAAIFAAKELGRRVAGYWLEQPYNSLAMATWRRLQRQLPPVLDVIAFSGMRIWGTVLLPASLSEIAPAQCVCDIPESCKLVILSGDADVNLPLEDVKEVFGKVQERARLVVFPGAGHINMAETNQALYEHELDDFLRAVQGKRSVRALPVSKSEEFPPH